MEEHPESDLADEGGRLRRSGPWLAIALVAVLTVVAVLLVPDEIEEVTGEAPADRTPPATAGSSPDTAPSLLSGNRDTTADEGTGAAADADPNRRPPGASARELIAVARASGDVELQTIADAAAQALRDGAGEDAYLLYFFAARAGHAGSAMVLGTQADPAHRDPGTGLYDAPDLVQAHKWYAIAADAGDPLARERLAELRDRVDRRAAAGDPEAQRISLLWQHP
jgi:hypothetical protein